jgi:hypothetical protein
MSATGEQKTVLKCKGGPFSSLFEAASCERNFSDYATKSANMKIHSFIAQ